MATTAAKPYFQDAAPNTHPFSVTGKTAIVTGAGSGTCLSHFLFSPFFMHFLFSRRHILGYKGGLANTHTRNQLLVRLSASLSRLQRLDRGSGTQAGGADAFVPTLVSERREG